MKSQLLFFSGEVAANSNKFISHKFPLNTQRIADLEIVFEDNQAGVLVIHPQVERLCGTRDNLLFPDALITGSNWEFHGRFFPQIFVPGMSIMFNVMNNHATLSQRYTIVCQMEEIVQIVEGE